jgi:hypothetical protein
MDAMTTSTQAGNIRQPARHARIPVVALGAALSTFLAMSYLLCVLGYLLFPSLPVDHAALGIFLPGFALLRWNSFALGLVESFAWGWYIALVFGPLYNVFAARIG